MTTIVTTKFQQRRKFLLILPLLVIPFLFLAFYALGGGKGEQGTKQVKKTVMGFNMELPPALFNKNEEKMDKLAFYRQADEDSIRKREEMRQDPYRKGDKTNLSLQQKAPAVDTPSAALLKKLDMLKRRIEAPKLRQPVMHKASPRHVGPPTEVLPPFGPKRDSAYTDPELDRLDQMLDKLARVRINDLDEGEKAIGETSIVGTKAGVAVKQERNDHGITKAVPAMVVGDQELVSGGTIALRLTSAVRFNGMVLPSGQAVYGMATLNNDRMQVVIHSIRSGQLLLSTDWQVYDMDGLPGIRVPDGLGRQAVRQSTDQSIGAFNLSTYDPSITGQMAGAGIQAARNFLSRKVRSVRVMVPGGYQVLLRDTRAAGSALQVIPDTVVGKDKDSSESAPHVITPPSIDSLQPYLHRSVSNGRISLTLKGVYQHDGLLWVYLTVKNRSSLPYSPQYVHLTIRQGRHLKRMAIQEVPVELLYNRSPPVVQSGEELTVLTAIKPFVPEKDKRLVMQMGEGPSGTELQLHIKPHFLSGLNIDHEK